ncbi:MAG: 6-bladed beta-propeller [Gemmatimonadota bacterium]
MTRCCFDLRAFTAAFVLAACGSAGTTSSGGTAVDSAGTTIWTIPASDTPAPFHVEPGVRLALFDSDLRVYPDHVAVDRRHERIYVLQEVTPVILVYDFSGAPVGRLGREGEGPGEYVRPSALDVDADGTVHVIDPGSGSIHTWSTAGEYLESVELRVDYWGPRFAVTPRGPLYPTSRQAEDGVLVDALVRIGDAGVDTLHTVGTRWRRLRMPCGSFPVPEVFYHSNVWAAAGDRVALADVPRYRIDLQTDGRTTASFRRALPPRRVSRAEAEAAVEDGEHDFLVENCALTPADVVNEAGYVQEISPFFLLSVQPGGRVWAARGLAPRIEAIDVFDPAEGYVGTLTTPAMPVAFLDDSRFVALVPGDWGTRLEIMRIEPGMAG